MKSNYFLFFILLLFIETLHAQAPSIQWQKTYGGSEYDRAFSICNTKDLGYAVVGGSHSADGNVSNHHVGNPGFGNFDLWLLKLDSTGAIIWNNSLGGQADEEGNSLIQTSDGGYIIAGYTDSDDGDVIGVHGFLYDFWVVKTDSLGNLQWQKCLGGGDQEQAFKIILTSDSGYLVVGDTESSNGDVSGNHGTFDVWAVKLNSNGVKQWAKCFGGSDWDNGSTCVQIKDKGFLLAASTASGNGQVTGQHNPLTSTDVWIIKIDSTGEILWQKCFGGSGGEGTGEIIPSPDGGFYIAGGTDSNDGDINGFIGSDDFWLFKIDSVGNLQWSKCYGGLHVDVLHSACKTLDGGIAMVGFTNIDGGMVSGTHGYLDIWVVKTDSLGNFMWAKALGGRDDEDATSIIESPDGGLVVAGYTLSTDGDITFNHGKADYWIIKLAPLGLTVPKLENSFMELNIFQSNNQLNLRYFSKHNQNAQLFLYDINGKNVFEKSISVNEGINYNTVSIAGLAGGMYFVRMDGENGWQSGKIVIQ